MPKRILVVDDEEVVLGAVRKVLRRTDYELDTVSTAEDALNLMDGSAYDLVITDLVMPHMDGLELMQRMNERETKSQTIMLTGFPTIQSAITAKKLGAFEYLTKPFTRQELLGVITRALQCGRQPNEATPRTEPKTAFFFIPGNSWVTLEPRGTARIGMATAVARTLRRVVNIDFPEVGSLLTQGKAFAALTTDDGTKLYLFSPLTGRVQEVNPSVVEEPSLAGRHPEGNGWLIRMEPSNPQEELNTLLQAHR